MADLTLKPREVIGFGVSVATVAVTIVLWTVTTFQNKEEAQKFERDTARRMDGYESEQRSIRNEVGGIRADTSYIRGRLEPKTK